MSESAVKLFSQSDEVYALVVEALTKRGIDCSTHHIFRYFASLSLSPSSPQHGRTEINEEDVQRSAALSELEGCLEDAAHTAPLALSTNDLPEHVLVAIAMRALPTEHEYFPRAWRILASGDFKPVMIQANCIFQAAALFHAEDGYSPQRFAKLDPEARFLTELHAVRLCRRAIAAETPREIIPLLNETVPYATLLAESDTAMARHFAAVYETLREKVPALSAGKPAAEGAKIYVFTGARPLPLKL